MEKPIFMMTLGDAQSGQEISTNVSAALERKNTILQAVHHDNLDLPKVTLELATPVPDRPDDQSLNDDDHEESEDDDDDQESEDDDQIDEDNEDAMNDLEEEDIEKEMEMTQEEKRELYEAVKSGDIEGLEDCLDKPNADIDMTWYKENMLMVAIRNNQQEMAEFLLDNGVDFTYTAKVVNLKETAEGKIFEIYDVTCRQLAYDHGMLGIVETIDFIQGNLFPFIHLEPRVPRLRRPHPPTPSDLEYSGGSCDNADVSSVEEGCGDDGTESVEAKRKHRRKRRKKEVMEVGDDQVTKSEEPVHVETDYYLQTHVDNDEVTEKINRQEITNEEVNSCTDSPNPVTQTIEQFLTEKFIATRNKEHLTVTFKEEIPETCRQHRRKPRIGSPSTKAAMCVARTRHLHRRASDPDGSFQTKHHPLKWRKIATVGSYLKESPNWHVEQEKEFVEIVDLRPSSAFSTTSSSCSIPLLSKFVRRDSNILFPVDKADPRTGILPPKIQPVKSLSTVKPVSHDKLLSSSYMSNKTCNSISKKRLTPRFRNSYSALDFR